MSNAHPIIEASHLTKSFQHPEKVEVLSDISLQLFSGETLAIMGASGEGKSTLLHILGALEAPDSGTIRIQGNLVTPAKACKIRNQHLGFIFQTFNLLEDYTALENALFPARIARKTTAPGSNSYERAMHLLERVGLADRALYPTKLLSGGEKQRVAIARALCNDPSLVLADEPSGNLDTNTSAVIHELLIETAKVLKKGLIVVTHDKKLASLCDSLYELSEGKLYPTS